MELIKEIFSNDILIITISGIATLLSGLISIFIKSRTTKSKITEIELGVSASDTVIDSRIREIKEVLDKQKVYSKWYSRADGLLIFGQYVIGALLASSLIQETLSATIIGALGIFVLLSSIIRQRYRPDLKANIAKRNMVVLKDLARKVEDDIFIIKNYPEQAPSIIDIRKKVTKVLNKIDTNELIELSIQNKKAADKELSNE